ncbi:hypothetical protein WME89_13480 [Sorangium sp. So ce321]|uniref:hypothetical protein n=1 Tax=Sorangium sp. So ce321 TaxID=3133300 RepID=UPI003F634338
MLTIFRVLATLSMVVLVCWLTGAHEAPGEKQLLLIPGFLGLGIAVWAAKLNPQGAKIGPAPLPSKLIEHGPYRRIAHPMYTGQWMAVTFFMWYGAGFWAAFSIALLSEIMFREYVWREQGAKTEGAPARIQ